MAMGGSHNNKGSRGRSYGLMLLLAFGAALFGVMVLHKLRERRIYTLLVKEKDHQLFSLQLLFQKEREYSKEMKRKAEEMKGKIYSLRSQKMELDRRLMEMQSTIDSLKDEHKAMESALEEKQNEIKRQRKVGKENSQFTAPKESLKQKEAEIEDLKRRFELYPPKVLSVSTDDPSNPLVNLTVTLNVAEKDKTDGSSNKEEGRRLNMSANSMVGENSTRNENRNESRAVDTNSREVIVEQIQKLESTQDEGFKQASVVGGRGGDGDQAKANDSQEQDGSAMRGERKIIANSTESIAVDGGHVLERRGENGDVKNENGHTTLRKPEHSQDGKQQEGQAISGGGMKLEMLDTMRSRLRRHGRLTRTKGKRRRTHAKASDSENNGVVSMSSWRFYIPGDDLRTRRDSKASKEGIEGREGRPAGERKAMDSTDVKLPKVANLEDSEYLKNRDVNAGPNQQVEQANEQMFKSSDSLPTEIKVNVEVTNITSYAKKQKLDRVRQPEEEASDTQQNRRYINEQESESTQKDDSPEEEEVADKNEPETEATDGDPLKESASNLEEDNEEYKADIDDSDF